MAEGGFEPPPQGHEPCMLTATLLRRSPHCNFAALERKIQAVALQKRALFKNV